jgi:NAD(P)-dependent dehydrogenase (short-subunit alcohol dehydrogenase family)
MDLGIAGKWALVCGASKGLGLGCAEALAGEGVNVVMVARGQQALQAAAAGVRAQPGGARVTAVAADITTPAGRAAALAARPPGYDIVVTNAGGPPMGNFRDWGRDAWIEAVDANMLTPIELGPVHAIFMVPARQSKAAIEARVAAHAAAWARRATTSAAFDCLARRVAPQKQRLPRCKSSPGVQPGCGLRLASTAFAGQRAP